MAEQVPIKEAETRLGALVRQTSDARVTLTDDGEPAAVLINPQELVDMEEALALADFRTRQAAGNAGTGRLPRRRPAGPAKSPRHRRPARR